MSQSDNKTPPANEKPTSRPSEMKLQNAQKADVSKPKLSALPPEDIRLRNMVQLCPAPPEPTVIEKVIRFFSRLFGK